MIYDNANGKAILFGGTEGLIGIIEGAGNIINDDTWVYDSEKQVWKEIDPVVRPPARYMHRMVFDQRIQKTFLFGGHGISPGFNRDIWTFEFLPKNWTKYPATEGPMARSDQSMIYDSTNEKVILFGGSTNNDRLLADTWTYDSNTNVWEQMLTAVHPAARNCHTMFFDPIDDIAILFGGQVHNQSTTNNHWFSNEIWAYNYDRNEWSELNGSNRPEPRYRHTMTYDTFGQQALLFGGSNGDSVLGDTWIYDYPQNQWTKILSEVSPSARDTASMIFDPIIEKVILFGGLDSNGYPLNDTWYFDFYSHKWEQITPSPISSVGGANLEQIPIFISLILGNWVLRTVTNNITKGR
jgi:N-acetylneuraminic acid mutarotase